jgi:hypothetical protein
MRPILRAVKTFTVSPSAPTSDRIFEAEIAETWPEDVDASKADADGQVFRTGCFDHQEGSELPLNVNHLQQMSFAVGLGVLYPLASRTTLPLRGRLFENHEASDRIWEQMNVGRITEVSIEFAYPKGTLFRRPDGIEVFRKATVTACSLLVDDAVASQRTAITCTGASCGSGKSADCGCAKVRDDYDLGRVATWASGMVDAVWEMAEARNPHRRKQRPSPSTRTDLESLHASKDSRSLRDQALAEWPELAWELAREKAEAAAMVEAAHVFQGTGPLVTRPPSFSAVTVHMTPVAEAETARELDRRQSEEFARSARDREKAAEAAEAARAREAFDAERMSSEWPRWS